MKKLSELHAGSLVIIGHLHSKIRSLKTELFSALDHVDTRERCLDHIHRWTQCHSLPDFSRDGPSLEMLQSGAQVIIGHLQNKIRVLEIELSALKRQYATNKDNFEIMKCCKQSESQSYSTQEYIQSVGGGFNVLNKNTKENKFSNLDSRICHVQADFQRPCDDVEGINLHKPEGLIDTKDSLMISCSFEECTTTHSSECSANVDITKLDDVNDVPEHCRLLSNVQMDTFDCDNACDPSGGEIHDKFMTKGINQCPCENAEQFLHKPEGLLHNHMECHEQFMEQTCISIPGHMCLDKNAALAQHNVLHTEQIHVNFQKDSCSFKESCEFHVSVCFRPPAGPAGGLDFMFDEITQDSGELVCVYDENPSGGVSVTSSAPSCGDKNSNEVPDEISCYYESLPSGMESAENSRTPHDDVNDARACEICGMTFILETAYLDHIHQCSGSSPARNTSSAAPSGGAIILENPEPNICSPPSSAGDLPQYLAVKHENYLHAQGFTGVHLSGGRLLDYMSPEITQKIENSAPSGEDNNNLMLLNVNVIPAREPHGRRCKRPGCRKKKIYGTAQLTSDIRHMPLCYPG